MGMDWGDILNIVNILFVDKEISGVGGWLCNIEGNLYMIIL